MTNLPFTNISIDGFRNLRNLNIENLGLVNIFVGGNNSGKTSLLEAISLICDPYRPETWLKIVNRRDYTSLDENKIQSIKWCFNHIATSKAISESSSIRSNFKFKGSLGDRELIATYDEVSREYIEPIPYYMTNEGLFENNQDIHNINGIRITHKVLGSMPNKDLFGDETSNTLTRNTHTYTYWDSPIYNKRFRNNMLRQQVYHNYEFITPYSYQMSKIHVQNLSKIIISDNKDTMIELIQNFDKKIKNLILVSLYGKTPSIYAEHDDLGVVPLSTFGDALRRVILWAFNIFSLPSNNGILLIDEIEVGLHTNNFKKALSWLVLTAQELKIQVFMTTHSIEAIDAIIESFSSNNQTNNDSLVLYNIRQNENATEVKRFADQSLRRLRFERGLDLR